MNKTTVILSSVCNNKQKDIYRQVCLPYSGYLVAIQRQTQTSAGHVFLSGVLCVVSRCQLDSLVLLWNGCDKGALAAICEPPSDGPTR